MSTRIEDKTLRGKHLTQVEIAICYAFFAMGCSVREVAKRMMISVSGASARYRMWLQSKSYTAA